MSLDFYSVEEAEVVQELLRDYARELDVGLVEAVDSARERRDRVEETPGLPLLEIEQIRVDTKELEHLVPRAEHQDGFQPRSFSSFS